jgi:preprotein translocase subunit SecD
MALNKHLLLYWPIVLYMLIIWAFVKMIGYALSMSGFAWLILSIGMAVDANILLYERLAEEIKDKNSISIVDIEQASSRSGQAIKDGNLTTMFIAILLAMMGVNVFKWYGTMMVITQLVTIIMVIPFTRDLLHTFYSTK